MDVFLLILGLKPEPLHQFLMSFFSFPLAELRDESGPRTLRREQLTSASEMRVIQMALQIPLSVRLKDRSGLATSASVT